MKIAFYHNIPTGGAKRVIYEEIRLLSVNNIVDVYTLSSSQKDFLDFSKLTCTIYTYKFTIQNNLPGFLKRLVSDVKTFISLNTLHKKIAKDIDSGKYDVVIVHPDSYTQAPFILKHLKTKHIYFCEELLRNVYESIFAIPNNLPIVKYIYEMCNRAIRKQIDITNTRSANIILTHSQFMKNNIFNAYGIKAGICPLGVDITVFAPQKGKKSFFTLIGMLDKSTGSELINALNMKYPHLKEKIHIIDFSKGKFITDQQICKVYSQSIATLCISYNEPFGLTAIESMACETPVIAVNEGGYKETIIDKENGLLINRNVEDLYEACMFFIKNPEKRAIMGKRARLRVTQNWTWEKHITLLKEYFKS